MTAAQVPALCIMADVIASRKTDKKKELRHITSTINQLFRASMLTDFTVRSGDELFGVLRKFSDGYLVLKELLMLSDELKVPLYVGVGIGFVSNEDLDNPNEVNGSAIWSAADALQLLKSEKQGALKTASLQPTFKLHLQSSADIPYQVLNYQMYFLFERLLKRTDKQRQIVKAVEAAADDTRYEEIGERFGYDKYPSTNVSKILARAEHHLVSGAEQSLRALLDYFQQHLHQGKREVQNND